VVPEVVEQVGVDRAGRAELGVEVVELALRREAPLPEEVGDLLERGVACEVVDLVAR